jgi:hypothetical protein
MMTVAKIKSNTHSTNMVMREAIEIVDGWFKHMAAMEQNALTQREQYEIDVTLHDGRVVGSWSRGMDD